MSSPLFGSPGGAAQQVHLEQDREETWSRKVPKTRNSESCKNVTCWVRVFLAFWSEQGYCSHLGHSFLRKLDFAWLPGRAGEERGANLDMQNYQAHSGGATARPLGGTTARVGSSVMRIGGVLCCLEQRHTAYSC